MQLVNKEAKPEMANSLNESNDDTNRRGVQLAPIPEICVSSSPPIPSSSPTKSYLLSPPRRPRRECRAKGMKRVRASSTDSLMVFKLAICGEFGIMPNDQQLRIKDSKDASDSTLRLLDNDSRESTLRFLGFKKTCFVELSVISYEEHMHLTPPTLETGFAGTMLAGN